MGADVKRHCIDMNRDRGDPIYIDSSAMLENRVGLEARGMAMDLISGLREVVWANFSIN